MDTPAFPCDGCGVRGHVWLCPRCLSAHRVEQAADVATPLLTEPVRPLAPLDVPDVGSPFRLDALAADRHGDRWGTGAR